jgi:hypothetical protein
MTPVSDSIYAVTLDLTVDSNYYFKFYSTHGPWGYWENDPNRELLVPPGGTTFFDYFNRDSICNPVPMPVTFECNMGVQICEMNFNPDIDTLFLRGDFNNWSKENSMANVSDSVWASTLDLAPGLYYQFKFFSTQNGGFWEEGDNREIYIPQGGELFYDYFNYDTNCVVPVELVSFTASTLERSVVLNWSTSTETNNKGFEVEKVSLNLPEKETSGWDQIAFAQGNGTTTEQHSYSFKDENLTAGKFQYRLKQIDFDGTYKYSNAIEVDIDQPGEFYLAQNYPNPFNPITNLSFVIGHSSFVTLKVYDILGNEVATLVNEEKPAGRYTIEFDGYNLASGIYYYQIKAGSFTAVKKLILLK